MMEESNTLPKLAEHDGQPAGDLDVNYAPARRVAVLVLGMHRSGSSAITRMLSLLGCALPATLMPASPNNLAGHWESDAIAHFNDEILALAGTHWHDWLPVNAHLSETLIWPQLLVARGRTILRGEFSDAPLFALKDPRICKLAGFWLEVLAAEGVGIACVVPLRNPVEVARSLTTRDGIEEYQGLLIWLRHVLSAEAATRGQPRVFTDFAALLDNWEELAVRVSDGLGLVWPRVSVLSGSEISQFLTPDLRHHVSKTAELNNNPLISPWVRKAYEVLHGWARHGEKSADHAILDQISREFDAAGTAFARPMLNAGLAVQRATQANAERAAIAEERDAVGRRLGEAESELTQARAERDLRTAERDQLAGERAALAEERDAVTRRLGEVEGELAQARAERDLRTAERDQLAGEHAALAEERDAVGGRLGEVEGELAQARAERDLRTAERDQLARERAALAEERDAVGGRLGEVEGELAQARAERDLRTAERDQLAGERAALAEARDAVARRLGEVEAEFAQVCVERDARTHQRDELAGERAALADECDKLAGRLGQVEADFVRAKANHDRAQACVSGLEDDLAAAHAGADALHHRLAVAESTLRQREEEIAQLGSELEAMRLTTIRHADAASAARDEARRLSQECRGLRDAIAVDSAHHAAEANWMRRDLTEAQTARQIAEDRASRAESQNDAQDRNLEKRFAELADLTRLLYARDSELKAAQQELAKVQVQLDDRLREVATLTRRDLEQEQQIDQQRAQLEWLRRVHAVMAAAPRWWAIMPEKWRRKRESRRLRRKGLFDADAYLIRYPDVQQQGMAPLRHYLLHGMVEGRSI